MTSTNENPTVYFNTKHEFSTLDENAGYDLRSDEESVIFPNERKIVKTDLSIAMPKFMYAQVFSRSGLASKGIDAKGGVIDSGYRNTIGVIIHNYSSIPFKINVGDRIAQLVFLPIFHPTLIRENNVNEIESSRGTNGFGSSGMK